jgi:glycosyltransferase involved in cell wall biosynthesis
VTPLKPVEALASSRPVVASDLPALAEIVRNNETGLLADAGDPVAFAAAIRVLLEDAELAAALGRNGRAWVLRERTWAANAEAAAVELKKLGVSI